MIADEKIPIAKFIWILYHVLYLITGTINLVPVVCLARSVRHNLFETNNYFVLHDLFLLVYMQSGATLFTPARPKA